ncbi:MAG: thiamine pyrophosphate-dependent enzyme, partial [Nitrospirales bacterium]
TASSVYVPGMILARKWPSAVELTCFRGLVMPARKIATVASAIGLGVALAKPNKQVVIFDGDGNVLMGMGTLATVGALKPKNFIHVVFDNEVYGSTGNQPTISNVVPLEKVAKAAGYVNVERVREHEDLVYEFKDMLKKDGPSMLLVKVNEMVEDVGRVMLDPPDITKRFMQAIK